jgi:hypothetical protein
MSDDEEVQALVVDNGSGEFLRLRHSESHAPRLVASRKKASTLCITSPSTHHKAVCVLCGPFSGAWSCVSSLSCRHVQGGLRRRRRAARGVSVHRWQA